MSFPQDMPPRLVVRESRVYQAVSLLVLLAFGGGMLYFVLRESIPLAGVMLLAGALTFFVLIQLRLLRRTLRAENWLMKFFSHGIALKLGGYLARPGEGVLFIPAEALLGARIVRGFGAASEGEDARGRRRRQGITFLEIDADKARVRSWAVESGEVTPEGRFRAGFIHVPVTETPEGYRVELRTEHGRVSPSVRRIAGEFRQYGLRVRESRITERDGRSEEGPE
jgi:hypothetical protein